MVLSNCMRQTMFCRISSFTSHKAICQAFPLGFIPPVTTCHLKEKAIQSFPWDRGTGTPAVLPSLLAAAESPPWLGDFAAARALWVIAHMPATPCSCLRNCLLAWGWKQSVKLKQPLFSPQLHMEKSWEADWPVECAHGVCSHLLARQESWRGFETLWGLFSLLDLLCPMALHLTLLMSARNTSHELASSPVLWFENLHRCLHAPPLPSSCLRGLGAGR